MTSNKNTFSSEQVSSLLRLVYRSDFIGLSRHPFASSKTVMRLIGKDNIQPYQAGTLIYDFITKLIIQMLNQLRLESGLTLFRDISKFHNFMALDDEEWNTVNRNKRLRRWTLLACRYIQKLSLKELSCFFKRSIRQIEEDLKLSRSELADILAQQESGESELDLLEDKGYLRRKRARLLLSSSEKESLLNSMAVAYEVPYSAFLWGDWSIWVSKRAVLVPLDRRVVVGLEPSAEDFYCDVYEWSEAEQGWKCNEWYANKMKRRILTAWSSLLALGEVATNQAIRVLIFTDLPTNSDFNKGATISLALAACISEIFSSENFCLEKIERTAAILESSWHPLVSWAPILCSSRSPNSMKVMMFDRTEDIEVDFKAISQGDGKEIQKNLALAGNAIKVKWVDFDLSKFILLLHKGIAIDLDEILKLFTQALNLIHPVGFKWLYSLFEDAILRIDYEKVGMMMNLHQDILSACDISLKDYGTLLKKIRSHPRVLGAKLACCPATHGGVIVLTDGNSQEVADDLADLVKVVMPFLTPTPGLVKYSVNGSIFLKEECRKGCGEGG